MIPLTDFLIKAGIIGLSVIAFCLGVVAVIWGIEASKDYDSAAVRRVLHEATDGRGGYPPITMVIVGPVFALILFFASKTAIQNADRPIIRVVVGTLCVLLLSAGLFSLKVFGLRVYAALEFVFALVVTIATLWKLGDVIQSVEILSLLSAAYLLIRAMDNFKRGVEDAQKARREREGKGGGDHDIADPQTSPPGT